MKTTDKRDRTTTHIAAVTVLGTGVLGSQIAYQTAYSGFDVVAYDINDEALTAAKKRFAGLAAAYKQQVKGAADGRADAALKRITYQTEVGRAVAKADLVIEAIPEKIATGAPLGPFQILDMIGLATVYNVDAAGNDDQRRLAQFLKDNYLDKGKLGVGSGEGFYAINETLKAATGHEFGESARQFVTLHPLLHETVPGRRRLRLMHRDDAAREQQILGSLRIGD